MPYFFLLYFLLCDRSGRYLSHWQIHWFFAQIQERTEEIASYHGIKVKTVNASNTSQNCHKCGKKGDRVQKQFTCKNKKCKWKGDSDLNAARNVCIRGIPKFLKHLKDLEKKRLKKLAKELAKESSEKTSKDCSEDQSKKSKKRQTSRSIRPDDGSRETSVSNSNFENV